MTRTVELPAPGRGAYDRSLSRVERDAQHRERLLLATVQVLREGDVTVARIVQRAGVGRSTFYEFFDGPQHVVAHLEQRALRGFEQALETAFAAAPTPLERLRAILRAWLAQLDARPLDARLALERRAGNDLLAPASSLLLRMLQRIAREARDGDVAWLASTDDMRLLSAAATLEALSRRHLLGQRLQDSIGGARALIELIVKILR
jgi:AcrR family transcriptional regulator